MSFWSLALGIFLQLCFALFAFMMVAFASAGIANGGDLNRGQMRIANLAIYLLPLSSLAVCLLLLVFYFKESSLASHYWHGLPVVLVTMYLGWAVGFTGPSRRHSLPSQAKGEGTAKRDFDKD